MAAIKVSPYIDMILLFWYFPFLWDCRVQFLFGNRIAFNSGLGGVRDVASVIIFPEQTQSNRVCSFQTFDAIFPKDLFSDYLMTIAFFGRANRGQYLVVISSCCQCMHVNMNSNLIAWELCQCFMFDLLTILKTMDIYGITVYSEIFVPGQNACDLR